MVVSRPGVVSFLSLSSCGKRENQSVSFFKYYQLTPFMHNKCVVNMFKPHTRDLQDLITRVSQFQFIIVPASLRVKLTYVSVCFTITSTDWIVLERAKVWTPSSFQVDGYIMVRSCILCVCKILTGTLTNFPDVLSGRTAFLLHNTFIGEGDVLNSICGANWAVDLRTLLSTFNISLGI